MRRNTSKAALYESIMRKVSRVVKNAINEKTDFNHKTSYYVYEGYYETYISNKEIIEGPASEFHCITVNSMKELLNVILEVSNDVFWVDADILHDFFIDGDYTKPNYKFTRINDDGTEGYEGEIVGTFTVCDGIMGDCTEFGEDDY